MFKETRLKTNKSNSGDTNTAILSGIMVIQTIVVIVLQMLLTAVVIFGAYAIIRINILSPLWLFTILAIGLIALSVIGISSIAFNIYSIIVLIKKTQHNPKEIK